MSPPLELWGGSECTVNRVGDRYVDQTVRNGHDARIEDLDLFASLGITAIRYPVLWERIAPDDPDACDWRWTDARLARLRELNVKPILGLVHHGSGPRYTSLMDPAFPEKLGRFAARVAERYPWADAFTPVNEPLTTARFSGLYGHWYPHRRDDHSLLVMLLNQVRGVVAAMRAIRRVIPAARLIQTDDLGKVFSTRPIAYQARRENVRRWLTFDLLTGHVDARHKFWPVIRNAGLADEFLALRADLQNEPCPPDIIGINHYLSSERFLDHRLDRYPGEPPGGNGRDRYVDVLALRVLGDGATGPEWLLEEAWQRYRLPIAVTEAHNGCTREEQMRWFLEVWKAAESVRARGADIRAVTAWALLGSFDWNTLLTRFADHYEPGVFDIRGREPRPTGMAPLLRALSRQREPDHPVLDTPGWWHRRDRLTYPMIRRHRRVQPRRATPRVPRKLLIVGATGTLGRAFAHIAARRGLAFRLVSRAEFDIGDVASVRCGIDRWRPWAVVNTAGFVRVDDAETDTDACRRANEHGPRLLVEACAASCIPLVSFSSDLVFDGTKGAPYMESDPVMPLCVYGRTKAAAESAILGISADALVIRTSAFFGPWDQYNFVTQAFERMRRGQPFAAAEDVVISPTYVPHLVHATLDLLIDGAAGLWHLANDGQVSWAELAEAAAIKGGLDGDLVRRVPAASFEFRARRPAYSVLGSERGRIMPTLSDGLSEYFAARIGC